MFTDPKRKDYEPPKASRTLPDEAEEKLKKAADAGRRDAAEMLEAIRRMNK